MGWVALALLAVAALVALRFMGVRGSMLQLGAAALLFGCAGYALQGRPSLNSSPGQAQATAQVMPTSALRQAFYGRFTGSERWLIISDSYARRGNTRDAVAILRSALREHPNAPALWVGLGNSLVDHAGVLTPASEFAFAKAAELTPDHPAPAYFMGLALARSGNRELALALWHQVLASAPAEASWRPVVEDSILAISGSETPPADR